MDAEQGEIRLDHHQHRRNGFLAERRQPLFLGLADELVAIFASELLTHRLEIFAGIEALGNLDRLAERLAIPQMRRAGEDVDLTAGIVDIIFAHHLVPGEFEQAGERIAYHRAAAMPHVHRPGRVGRDILDIDRRTRADRRAAIAALGLEDLVQLGAPDVVGQREIDEAGAGDRDGRNFVELAQLGGDLLRQRPRIGRRGLGEHHRRVGREIAVRDVARRLHRNRASLQPGRQVAGGDERVESGIKVRGKTDVESHRASNSERERALLAEARRMRKVDCSPLNIVTPTLCRGPPDRSRQARGTSASDVARWTPAQGRGDEVELGPHEILHHCRTLHVRE